jgi:hypothetical protein
MLNKNSCFFKTKKFLLLALCFFLLSPSLGCKKAAPILNPDPLLTLKMGDSYGGGLVAYLDSTGQHGLIVAEEDQTPPDNAELTQIIWHVTRDKNIVAKGIKIGTGQANTTAIVTAYAGEINAAELCDDLVEQGHNDWYLPSKDELNELYLNKAILGGFEAAFYWSSSDDKLGSVWSQDFIDGFQTAAPKNYMLHVRAVRAF